MLKLSKFVINIIIVSVSLAVVVFPNGLNVAASKKMYRPTFRRNKTTTTKVKQQGNIRTLNPLPFASSTTENYKGQTWSRVDEGSLHYRNSKSSPEPLTNAHVFATQVPFNSGNYYSHVYNSNGPYYENNSQNFSLYGSSYQRLPQQLVPPTSVPRKDSYLPTHTNENFNSYGPHSFGNEHKYISSYQELSSYHPNHHHQEEASFEIEDKVFTKTVLATKVLKVGKVVFTIIMVLVVLVLAGLGKAGVALSPVVLPIVLLPIGFLALLLFIPLFFVYVPLAATGLVGEKKKRSIVKQEDISLTEDFLARFEDNLSQFLEKLDRFG